MKVVFEDQALREYHDAAHHSENRFGLGNDFIKAVEQALAAISADPEKYREVGRGLRMFRMKRFPFYLFYLPMRDQNLITVYAVAHHARRPGYWRKRIPPRS